MSTVCAVLMTYICCEKETDSRYKLLERRDELVCITGNPSIAENIITNAIMSTQSKHGQKMELVKTNNPRYFALKQKYEGSNIEVEYTWKIKNYKIIES